MKCKTTTPEIRQSIQESAKYIFQRLSSTKFTLSAVKYFVPNNPMLKVKKKKNSNPNFQQP